MLILLMLFFFCPLIPPPALFASTAKIVREGNRLYEEGKYDEAVNKYNSAKAEAPDNASGIINFNLGAALYKQGRYAEAVDAFTNALSEADKKLEAKAVYNTANSKYRLGSSLANTDMESAAALYRESLDYYKRAIELDEENKDAKYNHDFVEKKLKALLDKMKKRKERKDRGEDKKGKEGKQDNGQQEDKPGKEKQGEGEGQQQETGNEQTQEKVAGDKTGGKEDTGETQKSAGAQAQENREMSPEEARMLLDAYGQDETGDNLRQRKKGHYREVFKDW